MGAINFSIDTKLIKLILKKIPIDIFVETGTYQGDTLEAVKPYFKTLISIELSEEYYEFSKFRFKDDRSITILKGDSGTVLAEIMGDLRHKSVLFWLDAHWCEDEHIAGKTSQCPLLDELKSIGKLNEKSVIFIDDARLFLGPPGKPHDYSNWPELNDILVILNQLSNKHALIIFNDVILYFPEKLKEDIKRYAHENSDDRLFLLSINKEQKALIKDVIEKEEEIGFQALLAKERSLIIEDLYRAIDAIKALDEEKLIEIISDFKQDKMQVEEDQGLNVRAANALIAERARIIDQLERTHEVMKSSINASSDQMKKDINTLHSICEIRKKIIEEQEKTINKLRRKFFSERFKALINRYKDRFSPRLGTLQQYPPRPFVVPKKYYKIKKISKYPKMSIVTPSYNHGNFIERTIKSVLEQSYPELEYIVQDGGSNDGTIEVLTKYHENLFHWESRKDKGQAEAINLGFRHSSGEIMAYLNSDDILLPGVLNYVMHYFLKHPKVDVVYGHRVLIDENDDEIGRWILPVHCDKIITCHDFIPQETLFWRRCIWNKAGGRIDESFQFALDWDLILRFRDAGAKFIRLPRFLGAFRVHPNMKSIAKMERVGLRETDLLRKRYHGPVVSDRKIEKNTNRYLRKHIILNKMYRLKLLRY